MKKPKTLKDLENDPRVESIHSEYDGCWDEKRAWWCYLKAGWQNSVHKKCHIIHEPTLKDVCELVHDAILWLDDPELNTL